MAESDAKKAIDADRVSPGKGGSKMVLMSVVLAVLLGGGGFYAVYDGLIPLGGHAPPQHRADSTGGGKSGADANGDRDAGDGWATRRNETPAFVALQPFVISLGATDSSRHLRVSLTIEVAPGAEDGVRSAIPRINDVLNTYLRAVDQRDFEVPRAMMRLRAHMLRRVRLVSPPDSVRDLLFQEFVLN